MEWTRAEFILTDAVSCVDRVRTHDLLEETYWGVRRPFDVVEKMIESSLCFALLKSGVQIGFARAVSDYTVFAWIADLVIAPALRSQGLGRSLMLRLVLVESCEFGMLLSFAGQDDHVCDGVTTSWPEADSRVLRSTPPGEFVRRFNVVIPMSDGGVQVHPMKGWLRQHPEHIPEQMHPDQYTSHQIREGLRRAGWKVQEAADEARLVPPGALGAAEAVAGVLGQADTLDDGATELEEAAFHLEAQLRDFIAHNLGAIDFGGPQLRLYADEGGQGIEYRTAAGSIDILATDTAGSLYVFELKRARSPDQAIGQLTRYMGALRQTNQIGFESDGSSTAESNAQRGRFTSYPEEYECRAVALHRPVCVVGHTPLYLQGE